MQILDTILNLLGSIVPISTIGKLTLVANFQTNPFSKRQASVCLKSLQSFHR